MTLQEALDSLPGTLNGKEQFAPQYWEWECEAAQALKSLGFDIQNWWMEDSDSFGPLVRGVKTATEKASYG